jgi:hypothetical protein
LTMCSQTTLEKSKQVFTEQKINTLKYKEMLERSSKGCATLYKVK